MDNFEGRVLQFMGNIEGKMENLEKSVSELKKGLYGDDGQGGIYGRMNKIEIAYTKIKSYIAAAAILGAGAANGIAGVIKSIRLW